MAGAERDVNRTDRQHTFFSGNDNPGLVLLHDVLMTYCMFNFDLGEPPLDTSLHTHTHGLLCGLGSTQSLLYAMK